MEEHVAIEVTLPFEFLPASCNKKANGQLEVQLIVSTQVHLAVCAFTRPGAQEDTSIGRLRWTGERWHNHLALSFRHLTQFIYK